MVRALLEGRKTQTRRVVKPQPVPSTCAGQPMWGHAGLAGNFGEHIFGGCAAALLPCPYGAPGDRLWVRETFVLEWPEMDRPESEDEYRRWLVPHYAATESKPELVDQNTERPIGWRSPIHMPRWASRITLEVTEVRVQRLQDISEEDAKAEGLKGITKDGSLVKYGLPDRDGFPGTDDDGWEWQDWDKIPSRAYSRLWDSINGAGAWESNPWVWAITFKRVEAKGHAL